MLARKLRDLAHGEDGAALVTTLAMFFFMFVTVAALYSFGAAVRERIQLQNACDAAAYSAAVVQADTLSRIATLNRQMAWTYVQMTRRQLDYIIMKLLDRACAHFESDADEAEDYAHSGILTCGHHKGFLGGWYIGASTLPSTARQMQINGLSGAFLPSIPVLGHKFNLGGTATPTEIRVVINEAGIGNAADILASGDPVGVSGLSQGLVPSVAAVVSEFTWASADPLDADTLASDLKTLASISRIGAACASSDKSYLGGQVTLYLNQLRTQILSDRLSVATLNLAERKLAREMPKKIATTVLEVLKANLPEKERGDILYRVIQEEHPLAFETLNIEDPTGMLEPGYFGNLHNNHNDERRFLDWAGYGRSDKVCKIYRKTRSPIDLDALTAGGTDQWFVRGNGEQRTEGMIGFQRCYKHWDEFMDDAPHNPYVPSCFNTEHLHESPQTVGLYCEWQWWADMWTCPYVWFLPPTRIHIPLMTWGLFNSNCNFTDGEGMDLMAVVTAKLDWLAHLGDVFSFFGSAVGGVGSCKNQDDDGKIADQPEQKKNCSMKDYGDGCVRALEIPPNSARFPTPFTQYERIYGDDKHLYNDAYVGECAKPLVLRQSYFGRNGTIAVGVARKTRNPWLKVMFDVGGLYSIFTPKVKWNWAFAAAKAGYRDPDAEADANDRRYRIAWDLSHTDSGSSGKKYWNLVQDDWDAVMVPVRQAQSMAAGAEGFGAWIGFGKGFLADWVKKGWRDLNGKDCDTSEWEKVAPPDLIAGDGGAELDWKGLLDEMYH